MAAPELRLNVSLNLAGFRSEIQKLTNIAQSEFAPKINVKFNRQKLDTELNNLQRAIKRRVYHVEIGGNVNSFPDKIAKIKEQLASLETLKAIEVPVSIKNGVTKKDSRQVIAAAYRTIRSSVLEKTGGKIRIPVSITPSITKDDIRAFKDAVKSKLTGLSVDVKANVKGGGFAGTAHGVAGLTKYMAEQGLLGKTASGMTMRMGKDAGNIKQQLSDAVQSAEKIKSVFDGVAKSIATTGKSVANVQGKRLGLANVPLMAGAVERRVEKAVAAIGKTTSFSELKELYPAVNRTVLSLATLTGQIQQNTSKLSGFSLIIGLAAFAGVPLAKSIVKLTGSADKFSKLLDKLGPQLETAFAESASNILKAASGRLLTGGNVTGLLPAAYRGIGPAAEPAGLLPPAYRGIGPSRNAGSLPGTAFAGQKYLPTALGDELKEILRGAANAFRDSIRQTIRTVTVEDLGRVGQKAITGSRLAGYLPPVARFGEGRTPGPYSAGPRQRIGETQEELFARREREARMRSALRGLSVSSEKGLRLPGTVFSGDDFTAGGGMDRVRGIGQPPQRGGAIVRHPSGPQLGPATRLPSDYFDKGGTTDKYRQALNLAKAATDNFRASQIPFIGGLKGVAEEFGEATKQVLLYGTAYKGLAFITSLPGQILGAAKNQQQFNNAMQVATQASGTYAKELLFVDNIQRAFGLDLETTRSGFTRLYASMSPAGFDSGSIEKLFVGISSAMAALQLTPDKAERVIYAFGQMASKGQVMSEELKGQLGDVLPGALAIFASAAGKSIKEFNKEIEDGVYSGAKFRDLMSKVTEELITRFGSGASAAGRSLQGLINIVKGDFTRTLESFAPLANSAAESILKPLGGALRQLSVATKLATGERGRVGGQVAQQEKVVQDLGATAALGGPNGAKAQEQYERAKESLEALKVQLENFNELAKDPAIARQAEDIKAFANEIGKAGTFVKNFAMAIGGALSPVLNFLGTNLTAVIGTIVSLTFAFQGARLALLAFAGVMTVVKGVTAAIGFLALIQQVGSLSAAIATSGGVAKAVATIFTSLGIQATAAAGSTARSWTVAGAAITFANGATIKLTTAMVALAAVTGFGLIAAIGLIGAAFSAMGQNANQAAEDTKQAAKDMAEAARTGNVPQVEAGLRQASADVQLIEEAQNIVRQRSTKKKGVYGAAPVPTLSKGELSEAEKNTLAALGISLPDPGATQSALLKQLNDLLAVKKGVLQKGKSQLGIAQKQQARTGQGIPDLGLQSTESAEDPNAAKATQRAQALLNIIEQREEAIANARKQKEEEITRIRKAAAEQAAQMERSLADRRAKIEREIAGIKLRGSDESADIARQIRVARGEDPRLVEAEQRVVDIFRKGRDERLELSQRIADEEKEQAQSIADFEKNIAKQIRDANEAHTKRMGEIQQSSAKQVAKLIQEGTNKAAKRLTTAAELMSVYIQRANAFSPVSGAAYPTPIGAVGTKPVYEQTPQAPIIPGFIQRLDERQLQLQQQLLKLGTSRSKLGIGEQFTALLGAEGGFEDVAGLQPLPLQKMLQQVGRPFTVMYRRIEDAAQDAYSYTRSEVNKMLAPDPERAQSVLKKAGRVEEVRQNWNPLEAEWKERQNRLNPAPRSKPSTASLSTFSDILQGIQRDLLTKTLSHMSWSGGAVKGDLSEYLTEGQLKIVQGGAADLVKKYGPDLVERLVGGAFKAAIREAAGLEKAKPTSRAGAISRPLNSTGGDEEWIQRYMQQTEPPQIIPGVQNRIEGAFIPGGSFDVSKVATDFGTIAAASILRGIFDASRIPEASRSAQIAQGQAPYQAGSQIGDIPRSQQVDLPGAALQTTQTRQRLLQEGNAESRQKDAERLTLEFAKVNEDSTTYTRELEKQVALIEEQARFMRVGVGREISKELAQLSIRRDSDKIQAQKTYDQAIREGKNREDALALRDQEVERVDELYSTNVALTFELERQSELLEAMGEAPQVTLNAAIKETQRNLSALVDSGNMTVSVASSVGGAFGEAFKGILTGSMTAKQALASFFQSVANSFADMVAQMITEYLKLQLMEGAKQLLQLFAPAVGAIAGGLGAGLSSGFSAGTASAIDTGAAGWGQAFSTPLKFANGGIASGGFTAFANGGIVTGPTLGLVGEGRYNEAVIPLPDGKSVPVDLGGAAGNQMNTNITVNVNNGQAQSNATGSNSSELGRKIEGAVKQVIVGELRPGGLLASR